VSKEMPAWQLSPRSRQGVVSAFLFLFLSLAIGKAWPQSGGLQPQTSHMDVDPASAVGSTASDPDPAPQPWWQGLTVKEISFEGVPADRLQPLSRNLPQPVDSPLDREKIARSLRELFALGLFDTLQADVSRNDLSARSA